MNSQNPELMIQKTIRLVEANENSYIRLNANGGNSILIVCEPMEEEQAIQAIYKHMAEDKFEIIDLNALLCEFVAQNREIITESFSLLSSSTDQIFKLPNGEEGCDLFGYILQAIEQVLSNQKIPVLIRCGALYGTGIEYIHIMEHSLIMKATQPLLILYPATRDNDKLLFLGKRPSSKYRCMIVE